MILILRAAGIAVTALVALLALRGVSSIFATMVRVGAVLLLFSFFVFELARGISDVRELISGFIDENSFVGVSISVMIKALGIALVGRICADVCKECGENGLAQSVELVVGIVIFSLSLPILSEILSFAQSLLQKGS